MDRRSGCVAASETFDTGDAAQDRADEINPKIARGQSRPRSATRETGR
jgi:hypothetical protein